MSTLRRLPPLALAALAVAAAVVLLDRHPPWPQLPASLELPVTTTFVQRLLLTAAWATLLILLVIVAARALKAARPRPPSVEALLARRPRATPPPMRRPVAMPLRVGRPAEPSAATIDALALHLDLKVPVNAVARTTTAIDPPADTPTPPTDQPDKSRPLRLRLLGPFEIEGAAMPRRKSTRELLAYLALHPNGATPDQLLEALWPDADPRRSRPRLWQSTSEARHVLGEAFVRDDNGRYALDRDHIRIDTDELAHLLEHAARADGAEAARTVEAALALWRGEPLDGDDYAWADTDLRQLRNSHIDLLLRVGATHLEDDDAHAALRAAERGITIDPLHEPSWRLALRAEAQLGLKDAVTARYDRLTKLLDDRLGIRPEPETTRLVRTLLV